MSQKCLMLQIRAFHLNTTVCAYENVTGKERDAEEHHTKCKWSNLRSFNVPIFQHFFKMVSSFLVFLRMFTTLIT